jgi:hypothetical protein
MTTTIRSNTNIHPLPPIHDESKLPQLPTTQTQTQPSDSAAPSFDVNQKRKLPCHDDQQLCQFVIETIEHGDRLYHNMHQSKDCYVHFNTAAQTALSLLHPIPDGGSTENSTTIHAPEHECNQNRNTVAQLLRDAIQRSRIAVIILAAFVDDDDHNDEHRDNDDDDDGTTITKGTTAKNNTTNYHQANYKQAAWILRKCFRTVLQQLPLTSPPSLLNSSEEGKEEVVATTSPASTVLSSTMMNSDDDDDAAIGPKLWHQPQNHPSDVVSVLPPSHVRAESLSSPSSLSMEMDKPKHDHSNTTIAIPPQLLQQTTTLMDDDNHTNVTLTRCSSTEYENAKSTAPPAMEATTSSVGPPKPTKRWSVQLFLPSWLIVASPTVLLYPWMYPMLIDTVSIRSCGPDRTTVSVSSAAVVYYFCTTVASWYLSSGIFPIVGKKS